MIELNDEIFIIPTDDKPIKIVYEKHPIISEEQYLKSIENLINNIGHLIQKDQI